MAHNIFTDTTTDAQVTFTADGHDHYVQVSGIMDGATVRVQTRLSSDHDWSDVLSVSSTGISRVRLPEGVAHRVDLSGSGASTSVTVGVKSDRVRTLA